MISAIIPIDLKRRPKDIINKALNLATEASKSKFKVIFGHNDRHKKNDLIFKEKLKNSENVKVTSITENDDNINLSKLRNAAFESVETPFVMLLDVDIYPDFTLFNKYKNKILNNESEFYILPCLYLTKYGTNILKKKFR